MKSNWLLIGMIGILAVGVGASYQRVIAYNGCGGVIAPVVNANYEQQVLDLTNSTRAGLGLPPLKRVPLLDQSAEYFAADMGQDNYFPSDHATYDRVNGNLVLICNWDTRITSFYGSANLASLAENIAAGYSTPQDVMNGWINSPGHYANIKSTSNTEIGIGYTTVNNGTYHSYWVQDFGAKFNDYPLIINRDAATTSSCNVSIYIYGSFSQMRLQNDSGAWGNWVTFQNSSSWTLAGGVGTHTVNAQLKSGSTTVNTSDSIASTAGSCGGGYSVYLPLLIR
jgi:uncharacterized protein YkwD